MRHALGAIALVWTTALAASASATEPARPNIVLIVADDVGFTDFGAYGSEIATPSIDALAARGVVFSNFHASPMCAPSRAMLMTGADSHEAGVGNLPESLPPEQRGRPGYLGELANDVVTIASRLGAVGYHTYMAGKWHLGSTPESLPSGRGFERSFALEASGGDNWEKRPYLPIYDDAPWFEDGAPAELPPDFYSSEFLVDKTIEYIDSQAGDGRPFFAYLSFQAIHIPVQAPREFVEKYEGVYDAGWTALRESRRRGAVARGLVPATAPMGPMPPGLRDWNALSPEERRLRAKSMAVNAGMLEAMDHHVGRLIAHLRASDEYDDTVFIVLSDNGPEFNAPTATPAFERWLDHVGYSQDPEQLGERGTFAFIGPEFASAAAAPFAFFKLYTGEGGVRVPLIVSGPGVRAGATTDAFAFVSDVAATILTLAGASGGAGHDGRSVVPVTGRDLLPVLTGSAARVHPEDAPIGLEAAGNAALYRGDLKLVRNRPPHGDGEWRLYDLAVDPGETRDLAASQPTELAVLAEDYRAYAARVGVLEVPDGYDPMRQLAINRLHELVTRWAPRIVPIALALVAAIAWLVVRARRRRAAG
jgi:arylsulfatase A-like enzyme